MSGLHLLDAFSCAGVGADGWARVGWTVHALDNDPAALRHNPYPHTLGDALVLLRDRGFMRQFHAVTLSPPCQAASASRCLADAQGRGRGRAVDLIQPVLDIMQRSGLPFVVENVERSALRRLAGTVRCCASSWLLKAQRHRLFFPGGGANPPRDPVPPHRGVRPGPDHRQAEALGGLLHERRQHPVRGPHRA